MKQAIKYGKTQQAVLDTLKGMDFDQCGYWQATFEIVKSTGLLQQSINRAIKRLISDGLVESKNDLCRVGEVGQLPKQCKAYILVANKPKQAELDLEREQTNKADQLEADKHGLSLGSYRAKQIFGGL